MYLLIQSEMLYLLAIAYKQDTWQNFEGCPEIKLSHVINNLIENLEKYFTKLSKVLIEFSTKKFEPQHRVYKYETVVDLFGKTFLTTNFCLLSIEIEIKQ